MAAAKKTYWATIKVPTKFLKTLPTFSSKNKVKKSSTATPKAASPANLESISQYKINTGPKEMSTSGLTMNSLSGYKLDKTSKVKKWTKVPATFKTFTGFQVNYIKYTIADNKDKEKGKEGDKKTSKATNSKEKSGVKVEAV